MSRESEIQRQVVRLYESMGCRVWPTSQYRVVKWARPGMADLVVFLPRRLGVLMHEVKAPDGRIRDGQREFRAACEMSGCGYCIGGVDEAIAALQAVGLAAKDFRSRPAA